MKKLLFVLPVVLLLAAGCNSNQPVVENQPINTQTQQTTPPANTQTQQTTPPAQTTIPTIAAWRIYTNNDFNFQLTFPTTWQGYMVVKRAQNVVNLGIAMYDARLKTSVKNFGDGSNVNMFTVGVYPKQMWQDLQSESGPKSTYITEKNNYVFAYSTGQEYPEDRMDLVKDVQGIISTFKLTK